MLNVFLFVCAVIFSWRDKATSRVLIHGLPIVLGVFAFNLAVTIVSVIEGFNSSNQALVEHTMLSYQAWLYAWGAVMVVPYFTLWVVIIMGRFVRALGRWIEAQQRRMDAMLLSPGPR